MQQDETIYKLCKRCNKKYSQDILCNTCKVELVNQFEIKVNWQTAYEIEKIQISTFKYFNEEY